MKVVFTFIMSSKGKKYSNTDPILITILKGWNSGFLSEEAQKSFGNIDSWDLYKQFNFYIWNYISSYLNHFKSKYEDDLNNLNILMIYGLLKFSIEKELAIMNIDPNALYEEFDMLLFENLALSLNDLSIFKEDKKAKELKNNLTKYWNKSFKNIYDPRDHSIPSLNNKVAEKLSGINIDKLKINENTDKTELIKKINKWSDKYEKACSDIGGFDFNNLKDFIIEYDWDTRFLWLISHANIINPENNLIEIYENSIFREYGKLVKLTFSILEKINIDKYEAIKYIPNLFIRLYDYLIHGYGTNFYHNDDDMNISQKKILYSTIASDFLLKPTKENTLNHNLFSVLGITFKCLHHENGLKKAGSGDLKGAIEDFTKSIAANPNQQLSYHDRALARRLSEDYKGAIADYTKVIELNYEIKEEDNTWTESVFLERGYCRFLAEDDEGAIADYTKVIEYNPESYIGFGRRGIVNNFIGDHEKAVFDFNKALDFYYENDKYELNKIILYMKRGDSKFALRDFKGARFDTNEAILLNNEKQLLKKSSLSDLYETLGCINTCLSKKDEALLCFSKAIELNPKSLTAYTLKAEYLYLNCKENEAALIECEKALNLNIEEPAILNILYIKSSIKIFNNKPDDVIESIKDLDKMIKMHQKFFGNSINQNKELSNYYLLKAKALYILNKDPRNYLIKAAELGNEQAKEILNELDNE